MLISFTEVLENLKRIVQVFRLQPGSTTGFKTDRRSIMASYVPALFLFPIYYIQFLVVPMQFAQNADMFSGSLRVTILYIFFWCLLPVIAYTLGYRQGFLTFLVGRNWLLTASLLISLASVLGSFILLAAMVLSLYWYVAKWFLFKDALVISGGEAFRLMLVDAFFFGMIFMWYFRQLNLDVELLQKALGQ